MPVFPPEIKVIPAFAQPLLEKGLAAALAGRTDIQWRYPLPYTTAKDATADLFREAEKHPTALIFMDDRFASFFLSEPFPDEHKRFLQERRVILITARDREWIYQVHKIGITCFLTTEASQDELIESIYSAWKGVRFFSPKIVEVLIELSFRAAPQSQVPLHEQLSERELEILKMVAEGLSSKEIAEKLYLSYHTINTHRKNILKKLSCKSAAELLNYAYTHELIERN
jgi:DNA-binding NarL/FixJ family response regulator